MIGIICLMFPALFSAFSLERLIGKKLNFRNFAFVFVTNALIINTTAILLSYIFSGIEVLPFSSGAALKTGYVLLFLLISAVVTFFTVLLERYYYTRLRIDFLDNDKESDNNRNGENDEEA